MKIGILNDFRPEQRGGGASRAVSLLLQEAQLRYAPRQYDFMFCTPGNVDKSCDAYICFLTKSFSDDEMSFVQTKPFVECGFDWWPPEDGNVKWRNLFYTKARGTVYVSPLHLKRFYSLYGVRAPLPLVLPPPLDMGRLAGHRSLPGEKAGAVWAAEWHAAKGPDLAATLARKLELHMDMYSPSMPADVQRAPSAFTQYAHPKGFVPEDQWYATLSQYRTLIHTPRVPDAFGYISLEAKVLGLEVIMTGVTGVESYGIPLPTLAELCGTSASRFWDFVEGVI